MNYILKLFWDAYQLLSKDCLNYAIYFQGCLYSLSDRLTVHISTLQAREMFLRALLNISVTFENNRGERAKSKACLNTALPRAPSCVISLSPQRPDPARHISLLCVAVRSDARQRSWLASPHPLTASNTWDSFNDPQQFYALEIKLQVTKDFTAYVFGNTCCYECYL